MRDYYRKPYMYDDYNDMMVTQTNESTKECLADIRKFEFLKPYLSDEEGKVEEDYERIVNDYTIPESKILSLYLLNGEDNFTLDYKRSHPPNKSHIADDIPFPWGNVFYGEAHGYTYNKPSAFFESPNVVNTTNRNIVSPNYSRYSKEGFLNWKIYPAETIDRDTTHTLEVFNGFKINRTYKEGTIVKDKSSYRQPFFSLIKRSSDAKKVKLLQRINVGGNYQWYDVSSEYFKKIKSMISNRQIVNLQSDISIAELQVSDEAEGDFRVKVSDGTTTIFSDFTIRVIESLIVNLWTFTVETFHYAGVWLSGIIWNQPWQVRETYEGFDEWRLVCVLRNEQVVEEVILSGNINLDEPGTFGLPSSFNYYYNPVIVIDEEGNSYCWLVGVTNLNTNPTISLVPWQGPGIGPTSVDGTSYWWRLRENFTTEYGAGPVAADGTLTGLPSSFTTRYAYDGYIYIYIYSLVEPEDYPVDEVELQIRTTGAEWP